MTPVKNRQITIQFNADKASNMQWQFRPQQYEIKVFFMLTKHLTKSLHDLLPKNSIKKSKVKRGGDS
jgi:cytochrome c oxidase assembly protein Cox11